MERELAPQIGEGRIGCLRGSDQCTEAVAVVVRLDFDLQAFAGRVAHHVVEPAELHGIKRCVLTVLDAFPQKRQPNHAHAFGGVVIDLGVCGIGIVGAENARHIRTEFSPGEIDSEKKRAGHGSLRRYLERCRRPTQKLIAFASDCEMRPPEPIDQVNRTDGEFSREMSAVAKATGRNMPRPIGSDFLPIGFPCGLLGKIGAGIWVKPLIFLVPGVRIGQPPDTALEIYAAPWRSPGGLGPLYGSPSTFWIPPSIMGDGGS